MTYSIAVRVLCVLGLCSVVVATGCNSTSSKTTSISSTRELPNCDDSPPARTLTWDAVELVAGREVQGNPEIAVLREGIAYQFSSPKNKAAFKKSPEKYEAVDGGACGRMGPLSGIGDSRRHVVHDGRIYFFASDACRDAFVKEPARFIESDDAKPTETRDAAREGRAVLDRVVAWAGGAEKIRGIQSYRESSLRAEESGGKTWTVSKVTTAQFPMRCMYRESWNESWFSTIRSEDGGATASEGKHDVIGDSRARAFDRVMSRSLVQVLWAHVNTKPREAATEFFAVYDGEGAVVGAAVEFVTVWLRGAATRFAIEKETGRPVQASFRGRDGTSSIGDAVRTYTAYQTINGVQLPTAYTVVFNGKELPSAAMNMDGFEVNPALPADLFAVRRP